MKLVDMKEMPDADDCAPIYASDAQAGYSYALQISLDDDDLKKLSMSELPEIGEEMMLEAKVKVIRLQDEQSMYGRCRNLGLQITEMALGEIGKESDEKY